MKDQWPLVPVLESDGLLKKDQDGAEMSAHTITAPVKHRLSSMPLTSQFLSIHISPFAP